MLCLFGVLPWNSKHILFEFNFSVSVLLQKDRISVNNTVKYLTTRYFQKVKFFCILCINIFSKGLSVVRLHYILFGSCLLRQQLSSCRATLKSLSLFRMDHLIKLPQGL